MEESHETFIAAAISDKESNGSKNHDAKKSIEYEARDTDTSRTVARASWPWSQSRKRGAECSSTFRSTHPGRTKHKVVKLSDTVTRRARVGTVFVFTDVRVEDAVGQKVVLDLAHSISAVHLSDEG